MKYSIPAGGVPTLAILLVLGGHSDVLRADSILISDLRFVESTVSVVPGSWTSEGRAPDVPFAPFDTSLQLSASAAGGMARATAFQQSVVSPRRFTGMGVAESVADAQGDIVGAGAVSVFDITFDLLAPHTYDFFGELGRNGNGDVEFEIAFAGEGALGEGHDLGTHGMLGPGQHRFYVWVNTAAYAYPNQPGYERASWNVDLSLQPVPEPGSFALLATGLVGLIARRRLRRA